MNTKEAFVASLREQIDKKYQDALKALETLAAYLLDPSAGPGGMAVPAATKSIRPATKPSAKGKTRVDRVLGVLTNEFKTIDVIQAESGISDITKVRAVLYSKFVGPRVERTGLGQKPVAFRLKTAEGTATNGQDVSAASLVRDLLGRHKEGRTASEVNRTLEDAVARVGSDKRAIGAALYNMKKRGKVRYDETTGLYTLVD